jgi:hypothetical protein
MKYHANAALTVNQRRDLQRLHQEEGWSIRRLAQHYGVNSQYRATVVKARRHAGPQLRAASARAACGDSRLPRGCA